MRSWSSWLVQIDTSIQNTAAITATATNIVCMCLCIQYTCTAHICTKKPRSFLMRNSELNAYFHAVPFSICLSLFLFVSFFYFFVSCRRVISFSHDERGTDFSSSQQRFRDFATDNVCIHNNVQWHLKPSFTVWKAFHNFNSRSCSYNATTLHTMFDSLNFVWCTRQCCLCFGLCTSASYVPCVGVSACFILAKIYF